MSQLLILQVSTVTIQMTGVYGDQCVGRRFKDHDKALYVADAG